MANFLCLRTYVLSIAPFTPRCSNTVQWRGISKCLRLNDDALTPRPRSGTNARHLNSNGGPIFQKEAGNRRNVSGCCLWPRYFHYVHFSLQSYQVRQSNHLRSTVVWNTQPICSIVKSQIGINDTLRPCPSVLLL